MSQSQTSRKFSRNDIQWCHYCDAMRAGRWIGYSKTPMTFMCLTCRSTADDQGDQ